MAAQRSRSKGESRNLLNRRTSPRGPASARGPPSKQKDANSRVLPGLDKSEKTALETPRPVSLRPNAVPTRVVRTEELIRNYNSHYKSFIEGFMANNNGGKPALIGGALTRKGLEANRSKSRLESEFDAGCHRLWFARSPRNKANDGRPWTTGQTGRIPDLNIIDGDQRGQTYSAPSSPTQDIQTLSATNLKPGNTQAQEAWDRKSSKNSTVSQQKGSPELQRPSTSGPPREQAVRSPSGRPLKARSPKGKRGKQGLTGEASNADEAQALDAELQRQHEACDSLRMLVFGYMGYEHLPNNERHTIYQQRHGTTSEIEALAATWVHLDDDHSGDVDMEEFINYFNRRRVDRLLGIRCVRYLCSKHRVLIEEEEAAGSRSKKPRTKASVTREDLMRLLWLAATDEDVASMSTAFDYFMLLKTSVKPPKLLSKKRQGELTEIFKGLEKVPPKGGVPGPPTVHFWSLQSFGIADHAMMESLKKKYDSDGDGCFDLEEFIDMLAPLGCRSHEGVRRVVCKDGRCMRLAEWSKGKFSFTGWLLEEDFQAMQPYYAFPD
eukprot:TRINITY_DN109193_c0_g1_i1.p1 TRINITY_DN109193_c0_g1~~TRINITY_DN109193_c0_g1_i1.p1  ORF type:complete len:552 (-),score=70.08 TRINITY_DN109193_c0_g1_i1:134-1789(-)